MFQRFCGVLGARLLCLPIIVFGLLSFSIVDSSKASAQMMVLPGKFDVSPQGSASFSIPVSVPPGTAGMVPSLSIDYTSGGGNGLLGVGWGVDGLLAITRCPQTLAQDGVRGSVTYTATDRFCLNGQRLIVINSGTYGADGAQYRTELEGFSNIVSHGTTGTGPTYFTVQTKSGQTMEFGNTSDSRPMLSGITSARSWLVDKISDTTGNYMSISYLTNPGGITNNSEVVPKEIDYTGNSNASLAPYNKVTFVYATRPDEVPLYTAGALSETTQRLTDIKTWSGTPGSPGSTEVNDYVFQYGLSGTGRSLLSSITMCDASGASGTCLPARTFTYQASNVPSFASVTQSLGTNFSTPPSNTWALFEGDFNGDGRTDFSFLSTYYLGTFTSNGNGTFTSHAQSFSTNFGSPPSTYWTPVEGDFNGDGRSDFALIAGFNSGTPSDVIWFFLSNGDGTFSQSSQTISGNVLGAPPSTNWTPVTGDFNGDGKTDIAFVSGSPSNNGTNLIYTLLSNTSGTSQGSFQALPIQTISGSLGSPPSKFWTPVTGDFNGDGKTDVAFIAGQGSGNQIYTLLSNGDGTFSSISQTLPGALGSPPDKFWTPVIGDFNGDGLTDVAFIAGQSSNNQIYTLLSKGNGTFINNTQTVSGYLGSPPTANWAVIPGDFNGDGLADVSFIGASSIYTLLSNGNGTFTNSTQTTGSNFGDPPTNTYAIIGGDFNGDGVSDFGVATNSAAVFYLDTNVHPDLLTSVSNGIGASTTVNYGAPSMGFTTGSPTATNYYEGWSPSSSNYCNTNRTNDNYSPLSIDVAVPMPVVTSTSSSTGIGTGSPYLSTFTYACALVDTSGRGFLGFAQENVTDPQTQIVQTSNFLQTFPFIGQISSATKTYTGATPNVVLNSSTDSYNALTGSTPTPLPWSGTVFPYVYQSVVASKDLDGTVLPTATTVYLYDCNAYGPTCASSNYGDVHIVYTSKTLNGVQGSTQQTTNTFQAPDLTHWFLGRLLQTTVVSTTP